MHPVLAASADYRGMLQQREADIAARRAAAADRLRANYKAENSKRLAAGVEVRRQQQLQQALTAFAGATTVQQPLCVAA